MTETTLKSDLAVIKATVIYIKSEMIELMRIIEALDGRLRGLEIAQATMQANYTALAREVNIRLGIFGAIATAIAVAAGAIGGVLGK